MKILKIVAFILFVSYIVSKRDGKDDFFKKLKKEIIFRGSNLSNENTNTFLNFMPELFEKVNQINPFNEVEQFIDDINSENKYERNIDNEKFQNESIHNIHNFIRNFNEFEIFEGSNDNLRKQNELNRDRHDRHDRDRHDRDRHERERRDRDRHDRHHHRHSKFLFVDVFHSKPLNIIFFVLTTLALIALITFLSIKIVKRCKKIRRVASVDEENISNVNRSLENPNNITNTDERKSEKNNNNIKETTTPYLDFNSEYVDINRYSIKESLNNDF